MLRQCRRGIYAVSLKYLRYPMAPRQNPTPLEGRRGRPKAASRMKRVNVSVDPRDYEALDEIANASGLSTAFLIRAAMKQFIAAQRHGKAVSFPLTSGRRGARN